MTDGYFIRSEGSLQWKGTGSRELICPFDPRVGMTSAGLQWTRFGLLLFVFRGWKCQAEATWSFFSLSLCLALESLPGSQALLRPLSSESVLVPSLVWCTWVHVPAQGHDEGGAGGSRVSHHCDGESQIREGLLALSRKG